MLRAAFSVESDRRRGVFACDGNGWPGDEVKAAREVLAAVEQKRVQAKLDVSPSASRASRSGSRRALGSDSTGRYGTCSVSRRGLGWPTRRRRAGGEEHYDRVGDVEDLLDGTGARGVGGAEEGAGSPSCGWRTTLAPEDEDDWRRDGHDWRGRRVAGSGLPSVASLGGCRNDPMAAALRRRRRHERCGGRPTTTTSRRRRRRRRQEDGAFHVLHGGDGGPRRGGGGGDQGVHRREALARVAQTWENKERQDAIDRREPARLSGVRREVLALHEQLSQGRRRGLPRRRGGGSATCHAPAASRCSRSRWCTGCRRVTMCPSASGGRWATSTLGGWRAASSRVPAVGRQDCGVAAARRRRPRASMVTGHEEDLEEGEVVFAISTMPGGRR